MLKSAFLLVCLWVILLSNNSFGQQYFIKSYGIENGLSTRIITGACQDKNGYMWFSTYFGISKYDGSSFTNFDSTNGLPDQYYRKIKCDKKSIIWAVPNLNTRNIIYLKDNKWRSITPPSSSKPDFYITSFDVLYKNESPVLCVGSYNGIDVYQNNQWKHFTISDEKLKNRIYSITQKNGSFYISTGRGICVLTNDKLDWSLNQITNSNSEAILAANFENLNSPSERLWLLKHNSLASFRQNKLTIVEKSFLLEDIDVVNYPFLEIRKSGDIIFGNNYSKYLFKPAKNECIVLKAINGFSSNGASSVFIDKEENIWITDSRGIDKITDISLVNYYKSSGMPDTEVTAITETNNGKYVLGHNNRISILENNKFKVIEFPETLNSATRVLDIMKDQQGNIWFTANNLGVGKLIKGDKIRWYALPNGEMATSIKQDNTGRIWVGTNRKLYYIIGENIREYEFNNMLTSGIRKIFATDDNGILITSMSGVWRVNKGKAFKIPTLNQNQALNAFSYLKDKDGTEFIGTMNGLFSISKGLITPFSRNNFKIYIPVFFILQDKVGVYWFGTNNGVIRWDGHDESELFNNYNGLAGFETNRSAGYIDSKGQIWIGTDKGLSCFTSGFETMHTSAPTVSLLSAEDMHGDLYPLNKTISLHSDHNSLSFYFRALSFVNEELITYKYKLEGFETEWHDASQAMLKNIKYVNLNPGKYRFCVMAKNHSSSWSKIAYSNNIVIKQPFYLTIWFLILVSLTILGLLYLLHFLSKQHFITKALKKEINERKIIELNLKESEQRLSFVLEGSRLGTWDLDINTSIIKRNKLWAEMLGYTLDELHQTQQQWLDLLHPDDREKAWLEYQNHLQGKTLAFESIYRMRTKDNQYLWIQDHAMITQYDSNGKPLRMSGTQKDITEQKKAADALHKSEESLRLLMASLPVAIYRSPVNFDIDLSFITGNVLNMTGFTTDDFLCTSDFWRSRLHPEDAERVIDAFKQAQSIGELAIEYRWKIADGSYKWIHDQSTIISDGSIQEFLGVFVDINNLKLAEDEIRQKNKQLSLINAEKDKLFSIISHDLRSPINGFLGLTTLLKDDISILETNQIQEIVSSLFSSATKVSDLVNDLLEWSQLQRGSTLFKPMKVNAKLFLDESCSLPQLQAKSKNIEIHVLVPENLELYADVHMLKLIVRNLLSNALKFTHKKGVVTVSVITLNEKFARITISDTGIGISPELQSKLFSVNEKTSRKGTEGEPSSGLGLILCKEFVMKQKGELWVESQVGKGSEFHFTIPLSV